VRACVHLRARNLCASARVRALGRTLHHVVQIHLVRGAHAERREDSVRERRTAGREHDLHSMLGAPNTDCALNATRRNSRPAASASVASPERRRSGQISKTKARADTLAQRTQSCLDDALKGLVSQQAAAGEGLQPGIPGRNFPDDRRSSAAEESYFEARGDQLDLHHAEARILLPLFQFAPLGSRAFLVRLIVRRRGASIHGAGADASVDGEPPGQRGESVLYLRFNQVLPLDAFLKISVVPETRVSTEKFGLPYASHTRL